MNWIVKSPTQSIRIVREGIRTLSGATQGIPNGTHIANETPNKFCISLLERNRIGIHWWSAENTGCLFSCWGEAQAIKASAFACLTYFTIFYLEDYALYRRLLSSPHGCHLGGLTRPFWHPGIIFAPWEQLGGQWEQQDGFEGVQHTTFIDSGMILRPYF